MPDRAMETASKLRKPERRSYEKPVVELVELHGDQVLSGGCKTDGAPSSITGTCDASPCMSAGSS